MFRQSSDVVIRKFFIANGQTEGMIVSLEGMSEYPLINEGILGSLMRDDRESDVPTELTIEYLKNKVIHVNGISETTNMEDVVEAVLKGNTAFFLDGSKTALVIKGDDAIEYD